MRTHQLSRFIGWAAIIAGLSACTPSPADADVAPRLLRNPYAGDAAARGIEPLAAAG